MSHTSGDTDNHKAEGILIPTNSWGEVISVDSGVVRNNLLEVEKEIAPCKLKIIGVTKYFGLNAIVNGYKAGLRDFGESRALDAISKIQALPDEVRQESKFHFIGHLQSNKAEKVVEYFDYIHSIDSLKLAKVVSDAACRLNKKEKVLLQVNNAKEEQKFGYDKEQLRMDMRDLLGLSGIQIVGLMNMAPFGAQENELRLLFGDLRRFRDELQREFQVELPELSMGMSDDYKFAAEEGATMIRIGRKLFK
jgi:pyridoxal phosphate enzyme (YggS family)